MRKIIATACCLFFIFADTIAQESLQEKKFLVQKKLILFPINSDGQKYNLDFCAGDFKTYFDLRLASHEDSTDYWVFMDVSKFHGQQVNISGKKNTGLSDGFKLIHQSDEIKTDVPIYSEKLRPQIHFSSKRGWINDPNGLVYYDGVYHLYYQHNPYDWAWGNMHWGHAVSKDLVHWEEMPIVLHPDEMGTMFSGSAVVDKNNTSGFKTGNEDVIVYAYSTNLDKVAQAQNLAYSNDGGKTLQKYENNPILPAIKRFGTNDERDPKVFWYEPNNNWVMVLHEGLGQSIYTSNDLKKWNFESHVKGFWECPELFELPIDGDEENKKWVLSGASGNYKLGSFDGKEFIPETDKLNYLKGKMYAAQTYNNNPDGRRIQIGWGTVDSPGMPFNKMMAFPTELSLKSTKQGPRLHLNPVKEIANLYKSSKSYNDLIFGDKDVNKEIDAVSTPLLHIKTSIEPVTNRKFTILINGYEFNYNLNDNLLNDVFVPLIDYTLDLEFIVDINAIEVFINGGQQVMVIPHDSNQQIPGITFSGKNETLIKHLEIHELNSIW
ncbi:glycoside hydrolase family 32 protein [Cyclobacterium qasimii]|uniref:Sucrose-6-phosphate hydrolase n=2 Tax=Cyclobacterium qasimii TaxID=1350429 RepID=S7V627_9BACT|nr:glycoside hydrolase family 32 protein [Cyclobacterium qasimii]EPR65341.1 Sucrose-6-phosphate hydrolase (EC 3.2.1.B3) [Cyclobacterium qasimii M12-11B]GEO21863.1 2,6-beta-D-fructofuranosidase [Cyclobacterium qasimii]